MIYIMADIRGNAKAYFSMKEKIQFGKKDKLYILGNVILGNSSSPESCLKILDDIIENDNMELIIGNYEFAFVMHEISEEKEKKDIWKDKLENHNGGTEFLQYMNNLPEAERKRYVSFLIGCEVSKLELIGNRYFYMVHGAPAECGNGDMYEWQQEVVEGEMELTKDYYPALLSEPTMSFPKKNPEMPLYIVCGNISAWRAAYKNEETRENYRLSCLDGYHRILFYKEKLYIDCECQGDRYYEKSMPTLACIGIDENEIKVYYKTAIFK